MSEAERRKIEKARSVELKRELNTNQLVTLQGLERFGWELKFIRRPMFQPSIAVVFDSDRKTYAILEPDGSLNEIVSDLKIRE